MLIDGKKIVMGDREFVMPPAPLGILRRHSEVFEGGKAASMSVMADVVLAALQRNYPELTQEEFETKYLDIGNVGLAFRTVMMVSGVEEGLSGERLPGDR
ncbi:MAG: hypothetical protein M0T84_17105 [Betaproteobacteria bacterium]|nr:hypothetical protein [Betaproteobacteria bacterium]